MSMDGSKMDQFWEDPPPGSMSHGTHGHGQHLSYERNLNFSTVAVEDSEYGFPKKKTVRDPLSHRIIEKRRRDRMNNCLADLARLLPPSSLRKGRGRIEKTEIVELAIKHLRHLQCHPCPHSDNCEYSRIPTPRSSSSSHQKSSSPSSSSSDGAAAAAGSTMTPEEHFRIGFQESMSETMHFLVEQEGMYAGDDMCVRLVKHLNNHCDVLLQNYIGNKRKANMGFSSMSSRLGASSSKNNNKQGTEDGSLSSGYQPHGSSDGYGSGSYHKSFPQSSQGLGNLTGGNNTAESVTTFDYEGDQNSCSSAQLSIEISDAYSQQDGKAGRSQVKPPIPTIICSHSSSNNSGSPPVNSSNSDEGNSTITSASSPSSHRYKFKNKIKQRFTEDLQTGTRPDEGDRRKSACQSRQSQYDGQDGMMDGPEPRSPHPSGHDTDNGAESYEDTRRRSSMSGNQPLPSPSHQQRQQQQQQLQQEAKRKVDKSNVQQNEIAEEDDGEDEEVRSRKESLSRIGGCEDEKRVESPVDKKPAVEVISSLTTTNNNKSAPTLPIIASVAGLEDAKALAVCDAKEVPAFALHDKGLFYIPLTIDKSIVSPFIKAMDPNTQPPLHPVTISVCFLLNPDEKKVPPQPPGPPPATKPAVTIHATAPTIFDPTALPHHSTPVDIVREPNNYIMNRFAQSQVPMIFGSAGEATGFIPCKSEAIAPVARYPFSVCGSSGGSISSLANSSNSSDPTVKLYHHVDASRTLGNGAGYYGGGTSSGSERSSGAMHENGLLPLPGSSSGGSVTSGMRGSRKRSISSSPSMSLGYHSWTDKSSEDTTSYMHGPGGPSGGPGGVATSSTDPAGVEDMHGPVRRQSLTGAHLPHKTHQGIYPGDCPSPDGGSGNHHRANRDGGKRDPTTSYPGGKRSRKMRTDEGNGSYRHSVSSI